MRDPELLLKLRGAESISLITYFASFYLTIFTHITPFHLSGKILDLFMLAEIEVVDCLLLGMLQLLRPRIMEIEDSGLLLQFFASRMVEEALESEGFDKVIS